MGKRNTKPKYNPLLKSYPDSAKINAVSEGAEVLYVRLIAQADDVGRYYGNATFVLAKLFTARMLSGLTAEVIESRLQELETVGLIRRYWTNGEQFLEADCWRDIDPRTGPQIRFPGENGEYSERQSHSFRESPRALAETPGQPEPNRNPTQPNPTQPEPGGAPDQKTPRTKTPSAAKSHPGGRDSVFKSLESGTLRDNAGLVAWFRAASQRKRPVVAPDEDGLRFTFAAAERAHDVGDNPAALFAHLLTEKGGREKISPDQWRRADGRLAVWRASLRSAAEKAQPPPDSIGSILETAGRLQRKT